MFYFYFKDSYISELQTTSGPKGLSNGIDGKLNHGISSYLVNQKITELLMDVNLNTLRYCLVFHKGLLWAQ